ncbi:hypothetical protein K402DRAFT_255081 [Aulographum hederae CBS 113979]|uniref:SET domain-containing protein n=1 Tax=Aulographum hederae CBS 113979 TaxID=1176131 RepID=A0A6G1GJ24_9PEZI|nr:hypothetical protein K402DRAFT_255081 [Aulographum hederae CBS 113979]
MKRAKSVESASSSSTLSNITVAPANSTGRNSLAASDTPPTSLGDMEGPAASNDAQKEPLVASQVPPTPPVAVNLAEEQLQAEAAADLKADANANTELAENIEGAGRRSSRPRKNVATYNTKKLAGTSCHTPTKYLKGQKEARDQSGKGEQEQPQLEDKKPEKKKRDVSGSTLVASLAPDSPGPVGRDATKYVGTGKKLPRGWVLATDVQVVPRPNNEPVEGLRRRTSNSIGTLAHSASSAVSNLATVLSKRGRDAIEAGMDKVADIGRRNRVGAVDYAENKDAAEPAKKRARLSEASTVAGEDAEAEIKSKPKPKAEEAPKKIFLKQGLYVGQAETFDARFTTTKNQAKRVDSSSIKGKEKESTNAFKFSLPMFSGKDLIEKGQDFKLPFWVMNAQPFETLREGKDWSTTRNGKNKFIGDAKIVTEDTRRLGRTACLCDPLDGGCDERCLNVSCSWECDDRNCNAGVMFCKNRKFKELATRTARAKKQRDKQTELKSKSEHRRRTDRNYGGLYDIGIEIVQTGDRGHGVRAVRSFQPGQIILEYSGEVITQEECDHRMNTEYKKNNHYYLMTFHQNLIIDATKRGSAARFVNHSCDPNCRVEKWIVGGEPRMALFAGDNGIMTGEELTYDYNFDPFSDDNVQTCHCGSAKCRGFLGPTPKEREPAKPKGVIAGLKRGISHVLGQDDASSKRQKLASGAKAAVTKARDHVSSVTDISKKDAAAEALATAAAKLKAQKRIEDDRRARAERLAHRHNDTDTPSPKETPVKHGECRPSTTSIQKTPSLPRSTPSFSATPEIVRQHREAEVAVRKSSRTPKSSPKQLERLAESQMKDAGKARSKAKETSEKLKNSRSEGTVTKTTSGTSSKAQPNSFSRTITSFFGSTSTASKMKQSKLPFTAINPNASSSKITKSPKAKANSKVMASKVQKNANALLAAAMAISDSEDDDGDEEDQSLLGDTIIPSPAKRASASQSMRGAIGSMRAGVVNSVKGSRRAAAVARAGGRGNVGKSMRIVSGQD